MLRGISVFGGSDADGVGALVGRVVEDTRELVRAEIELYKARFVERASAYRSAIVFFVIAAVLALAALIALLVGLIITVATLVGPGFATLIVIGLVLAIAAVLALVGKRKLAPPDLDPKP